MTFGPHFADELKAAGLLGLPLSGPHDGICECWDEQKRRVYLTMADAGVLEERKQLPGAGTPLTEAQITALKDVLAAHDPNPPMFRGYPVWSRATMYEACRCIIEERFPPSNQQLKFRKAIAAVARNHNPEEEFVEFHEFVEELSAEAAELIREQGW